MDSLWNKGYSTPKEKDQRAQELNKFKKAFKELTPLIESKIVKPTKSDYDNPSWAYMRADTDGYNRALTQVLDLLKL